MFAITAKSLRTWADIVTVQEIFGLYTPGKWKIDKEKSQNSLYGAKLRITSTKFTLEIRGVTRKYMFRITGNSFLNNFSIYKKKTIFSWSLLIRHCLWCLFVTRWPEYIKLWNSLEKLDRYTSQEDPHIKSQNPLTDRATFLPTREHQWKKRPLRSNSECSIPQ